MRFGMRTLVKLYLDKHHLLYEARKNKNWMEYVLEKTDEYEFFIRCNDKYGFIRFIFYMPLEDEIVESKRNRLLNACNIINRGIPFKATLQTGIMVSAQMELYEGGGILATYVIPRGGLSDLDESIEEPLEYFQRYFNKDIIYKAIDTDEDLYEYDRRWWKMLLNTK